MPKKFDITQSRLDRTAKVVDNYLRGAFPRTFGLYPTPEEYVRAKKSSGAELTLLDRIHLRALDAGGAFPIDVTKEVKDAAKRQEEIPYGLKNAIGRDVLSSGMARFVVRGLKSASDFDQRHHGEGDQITIEYQPEGQRPIPAVEKTYFWGYTHNKKRGRDLVLLAHALDPNGETITPRNVIAILKERLRGKRILSLGDDTGSLSEVLAHFGAHPAGVEYQPDKVKLARTGIYSEDKSPNTHVIQGDVWRLLLRDSALTRKLVNHGKFDAVFSTALFNDGSGGEFPRDPLPKYNGVRRLFESNDIDPEVEDTQRAFALFMVNTEHLLKPGGVQVHAVIDIRPHLNLRNFNEDRDAKLDRQFLGKVSTGKLKEIAHDVIALRKG